MAKNIYHVFVRQVGIFIDHIYAGITPEKNIIPQQ